MSNQIAIVSKFATTGTLYSVATYFWASFRPLFVDEIGDVAQVWIDL